MNIDLMAVIAELGGGLSAVVIVVLAVNSLFDRKRINYLTDTIITMGQAQTEAMNDLARQIEKADQK